MRRYLPLIAVVLVLFLTELGAAQKPLVEYHDKNDPCNRFKMRILSPADNSADQKLRTNTFGEGNDSKMVWNPCPHDQPQFAFQLMPRLQQNVSGLKMLHLPVMNGAPTKPPELRGAFRFKWLQQ